MSKTVLVCAPSTRTAQQESIYRWWSAALQSRDLRIEVLVRANYSDNPWAQLSDLMARADGVLVLGFRQMEILRGVWRRGTAEAEHVSGAWSSPWVQVEAGMAIALGKPVLVAPEPGVCEGVFASENWNANVFGVAVEHPDVLTVERWTAAVHMLSARRDAVNANGHLSHNI